MSYCGISNVGGGGGDGDGEKSTSTSRKSKKNGGSDKPKQPQRGLGVAQLEQIRLRTQLGSNFTPPNSLTHHHHGYTHAHHAVLPEDMRMQGVPYGVAQSSSYPPYSQSSLPSTSPFGHHHPNFMMFLGDERANLRYHDSQTNATRWNPNNNGLQDSSSYFEQGVMASNNRHLFNHEESKQRIDLMRSRGSINQNSDSSDDHEEVDLELRLSI